MKTTQPGQPGAPASTAPGQARMQAIVQHRYGTGPEEVLALCEALGMKIHFVAPAFGFQKNMPYPDNAALTTLAEKQWEAEVAKMINAFGADIAPVNTKAIVDYLTHHYGQGG